MFFIALNSVRWPAVQHIDGRFPLAYAGRCEAHLARYRLSRATENYAAAELACHRAWGRLADAERYVPGQDAASQESYHEAIKLVTSQLVINPDEPEDLAYSSIYLTNIGELNAARIAMNRALDLAPENPNMHYAAAILELNSGDRDAAMNELQHALRSGYSLRLLINDPEFVSIRNQDNYQALISSGAYARTE